ncbi:uncharacterized membrane protein YuzA (DUF378 family) [Streptomyces africanus]|uniref:Uncharacterized membrane protein YuzA (DUF378 family) n=1 Tax=Streptomyces africanus TaxID=231024 RepID=A0ABU0QSI5_9ACTN|nr:hypothetical protein [Streptomyces africanus]MDQ0750075.1 uncharacterized membrane protein YuzA (DUF378 family) [Streptomyces africanus]
MRYVRHVKGAVTVTAATAACHTLMSAGFARAHESAAESDDEMWAGAFEFLLTTAASWVLMPLLLWAGMRMMGETHNAVLVAVGGLFWSGVSGYFTDDIDRVGGHIPFLALAAYILLGTGLAGAGSSHRD